MGRDALPCQISPKSVKPSPRHGDFSIFQDGGGRHVGFLKFHTFNGRTAQEGRSALPCQIWSKSVEPRPRYGDFSIFPRWRPSAILDLWCVCSDHPRRVFGGLYHRAKFGWIVLNVSEYMLVLALYAWLPTLAALTDKGPAHREEAAVDGVVRCETNEER